MNMKMFRSIGLALSMACLAIAGSALRAASELLSPVFSRVGNVFRDMACGVEKLHRELAHAYAEGADVATGVGAGLDRDGNGYRQSGAWPGASHTALTM